MQQMAHYHCILFFFLLFFRLKLLLLSNRINNDIEKKKRVQENLLKEIKRIKQTGLVNGISDSDSEEENERMNFPELEGLEEEKEGKEEERTDCQEKVDNKWDIISESTLEKECNENYEKKIEDSFKIQKKKEIEYPSLTEALLQFHNSNINMERV